MWKSPESVSVGCKIFSVDTRVRLYDVRGMILVPQDLISYDSRYCSEIYSTSPNGGVAKIQVADLEIFPYTDLPQNMKFTRTYDRPNEFFF